MRRAVRRVVLPLLVFAAVAVVALLLVLDRPAGFIPDEDQGMLLTSVTLPPGASQQRTEAVMNRFQQHAQRAATRSSTSW